MRLSLFRSKSSTPSNSPSSTTTKKSHRLTQMLSPSRTNNEPVEQHASPNPSSSEPRSPTTLSPTTALLSTETSSVSLKDSPPTPSAVTSNVDNTTRLVTASNAPNGIAADDADDDDNLSAIDERVMTRKLMEVESSFLPNPASASARPGGTERRKTNMLPTFSGTQSGSVAPPEPSSEPQPVNGNSSRTDQMHQPTNSTEHRDFARQNNPFNQSPLQHRLSSPTAAAAQRSKLRAASASLRDNNTEDEAVNASLNPARQTAAASTTVDSYEQESTPRQQSRYNSSHMLNKSQRLVSEPTQSSSSNSKHRPSDRFGLLHSRQSKRPYYLQSHQSSQRASRDSFMSQRSEATIGPDYEGPSGGATPHTQARTSRELSRLPSFGSIASSLSDGKDSSSIRPRKSTTGSAQNPYRRSTEPSAESSEVSTSHQRQTTPRASMRAPDVPTNTVIAQHVRDVEVPDTIAREYRAAHSLDAEAKHSTTSTPLFGRGKRELTLKEQNTRLDKLSKENFDLKLKIHYLDQALNARSDEGVRDLISQNADLQADALKLKKENQTLRKRLKELEGKSKGLDSASASHQLSVEGSEDDSSHSYLRAQLEDEISSLRDQVQSLQDDNTRLLHGGQPEWDTLQREIDRRQESDRRVLELERQIESIKRNGERMPHLRIRASNNSLAYGQSNDQDVGSISGTTLVVQLQQENATLKRDLGVQTDMLSSRNKERERLQQEIEDLKLVQRRNERIGSTAGDSVFDQSISRSQNRSISRASASTRESPITEQDRDRFESIQSSLRDEIALLKMRNQDLQAELNTLGEGAEHIRTLQRERDEATRALREADGDIDYLYSELDQLEELVLLKEQDIEALENTLRGKEEEMAEFQREFKEISASLDTLGDDREANEATIQSLQQDIVNASAELEAMELSLRDLTATKERLEVQQESAQNEISFLREEQECDKIKIGDLQSALQLAKSNLQSEESRLKAFEALEQQTSKARDEARQLRKTLVERDSELRSHKDSRDELKETFDKATRYFEATKTDLLEEIRSLKVDAEEKLKQLDQAGFDYDEKDRLLRDREALLELSGHETRRLKDIVDKERQGRKHDRNEYDRALRTARGNPEGRIVELETANNKHKRSLAELQARYEENVGTQHDILLSLWNRLSGLCTKEKLMESEQAQRTTKSLVEDLTLFDEELSKMLEAIESHVDGFREKVSDTETSIKKEAQRLQDILQERLARISNLEDHVDQLMQFQTEQSNESAATVEYAARLKHENKLLKRELRYLKEGSFALPGLPSPQDAMAASLSRASSTGGRGSSRDRSVPFMNQAISPVVSISKKRQSRSNRSNPPARAYSANDTDMHTNRDGMENGGPQFTTDNQQQLSESQAQQRSVSTITAIHHPTETASSTDKAASNDDAERALSNGTTDQESSEQRWILRYKEIKRRLEAEREGRLLDRDGARKRLDQGKRENDALKEELRREKVRTATAIT